jgi:hypothetical protein
MLNVGYNPTANFKYHSLTRRFKMVADEIAKARAGLRALKREVGHRGGRKRAPHLPCGARPR